MTKGRCIANGLQARSLFVGSDSIFVELYNHESADTHAAPIRPAEQLDRYPSAMLLCQRQSRAAHAIISNVVLHFVAPVTSSAQVCKCAHVHMP